MARRLRIAPRTLRDWVRVGPRPAVPLGRPVHRSPRPLRTEVLAFLAELGPATSVATLRECFPEMPRSELADMLRRYRFVLKKRYPERSVTLHWTAPGTVWAIDHTETPPIDGREELVLAARDLASGQQLLAWPSESTTAEEARTALALLFAREGVPLVLKMDNGSPFVAEEMDDFLAERGVFGLYSPPRTPQYNGAIEAGIGSLKSRVERRVAAKGTPDDWSRDDLEAARLEANALARPRGENGPTPDELWAGRRQVTVEDRARFGEAVERHRRLAMEEEGLTERPASKSEARCIDRVALRRALVEHGFLFIQGKANSSSK